MKTAFIGLDYIIDITHPEGKIARSASQVAERKVIAHANHVLAHARAQSWLIVQVKVGFAPQYQNHPAHSPFFGRAKQFGALQLGSRGTEFHPDLDVRAEDLVVVKHRVRGCLRSQYCHRMV